MHSNIGRPFISAVQTAILSADGTPEFFLQPLFDQLATERRPLSLDDFELYIDLWHGGEGEDIRIGVDGDNLTGVQNNWIVTAATTPASPLRMVVPPWAGLRAAAAVPAPDEEDPELDPEQEPVPGPSLYFRVVCRRR